MRRILGSIVLVILLFLGTVLCTGVNFLCNIDIPAEQLDQLDKDAFAKGNLRQLFFIESFRQMYPDLRPSGALFHIPTMAFAGLLVLSILYFFGQRKNWSAVYIGLLCIVSGFVPYLTGKFVLTVFANNFEFSNCGLWIAVMILGMLYCWIAAVLFVAFDIFKIDPARLIPRISLRKPYFIWRSAVS